MMLKDIDPKLRRLLIQAIRTWFPRTEKYKKVKDAAKKYSNIYKKSGELSKKKAVSYKCNICKEYHKAVNVEVDHIREVIDVASSSLDMTIDTYIKKVDCPMENLQVVCKTCHKEKTKKVNESRLRKDRLGKPLKKYRKPKKKPCKIKI